MKWKTFDCIWYATEKEKPMQHQAFHDLIPAEERKDAIKQIEQTMQSIGYEIEKIYIKENYTL